MPIFGFDNLTDAFNGGGAGKSGPTYSFEGSSFDKDRTNNYVAPAGMDPNASKGGGLSNLLSVIGLVASGGNPLMAALGSGIGSLLTGGGVGGAANAAASNYALGATTGPIGLALNGLSGGYTIPGQPKLGPDGKVILGPDGKPITTGPGQQLNTGVNGLLEAFNNPVVMAALLKSTEPKNVSLRTPAQDRQLKTGERSDYQGKPAFDYTYNNTNFAKGGFIAGPGTGTSDSIPARIYQNGKPSEEARLSDGEFVMTNRAVRGAGGGDRARGAAEMYRLMRQFERRS
jgi:hypothetical protein